MTLQRTRQAECLSDLVLDRLLAGELAPGESHAAQQHLGSCSRCNAQCTQLERDRERYRLAPPPLQANPERHTKRWASWRLWLLPVGALSAAAVLILLLRPGSGHGNFMAEATQTKGSIRLGFYVKRGDTVRAGHSGDIVYPGEAVRFTYTSRTSGYLAVVSLDGAGKVSVYHPDPDVNPAAPLAPAEDEPLPGSILLDDALGTEAVYGVLCSEPRALIGIVEQLRRERDLPAVSGCAVDKVILEKRSHE